ncbi:hypothetical protein Val02_48910 [Virgisporangium aliadipatigenens]|uniref:Carrier domain-containing protein n=1 Tax=Virgisporangium aliadipatigenens TaxID=741659 RepID=A0A8J3YQA0_9ACTN|nr:amino acid adenylation domain-containing protein [Virgisporangium aliadipatigenens]GIJ48005.1 hypothetical protein Val02_48910 [Virgisporangium aliadipatigenens]
MPDASEVVRADSSWNGTARPYPDDNSIAELFVRQAKRAPSAVAVVDSGRRVSYAELDGWSGRLAARLADSGVESGEPVGLIGERGLEAVVGMLGILRAGACYVPLHIDDPVGRLRALTSRLGMRRLVATPGAESVLDGPATFAVAESEHGPPVDRPVVPVGGGGRAYVMFTSGSTGTPKAVAVAHRAVCRLVLGTDFVRIGPEDRLTHTGHLSFDAAVFEIWGALLNGARIVVVPPEALSEPDRLARLIDDSGATVTWLSAGVFHHCARLRPDMFGGLRYLISGGDVLNPQLVRRVLSASSPENFVNGYGPTENTTFSTTHRIGDLPADTARIPIGRPVANSTCHILTDDGTPAPVGVEGELWVGGDGVAFGYLDDPDLTAQRFRPDPSWHRPGAQRFRTGDLARWLPDGTIDFLGRRDRMVKFRDFRIELDEIEAALSGCPGVADAAVVALGERGRTTAIAGFYVPAQAHESVSTHQVHRSLTETLPQFMLPTRLVPLPRFPLTSTGKVDRAALADTLADGRGEPHDGHRPLTAIESGLARLWAEALDVDEVLPDDNFFELGGNSLTAARIFARLHTMFGIDPAQGRFLTARLLADPSLRACAVAVEQARAGTLRRDGAGADVDFARESRLDTPVRAANRPPAPLDPRRSDARILLTGASGFLGSHLLRRLLTTTDAEIVCLVRAADDAAARRRLSAAQEFYRLGDLPAGRVTPLVGDLGRPLLGLSGSAFDRCADSVDLVLHCGAYVNFTYPYSQLAPVTVGGARELVRLAAPRGVPIHAVSTLAVLAGFGAAGVREVSEDTPLAHPEQLYMGYTEAKWVAEAVLRRAADAGLPVAVHRPYEVAGDLTHGAWNLENATCALFRLIVDTGLSPAVDMPLDLVPVDVLAAQIVHIALTRTRSVHTYHLTNPRPASLDDMVDVLRAHGYPVRRVPFEEWVAEAVRHVCDHPGHPFTPFVPLWVDRSPRSGLVVKEMYLAEHFPRFGREHARDAVAGLDAAMPAVDADLLGRYVAFFQRAGYFPPPPR